VGVGSQAISGNLTSNTNDLIASFYAPTNLNYFDGLLDDVATWNRALAADEVRYLGSGSGKPCADLRRYLRVVRASSDNWNTDAKWRAGIEPTASYDAHIDSGATVTVSAAGEVCNNLYIGDASNESGTLSITGGTLTVSGTVIDGSGSSTININGGTLSVTGATITADAFNVGNTATGSFALGAGKTLAAPTEIVGNSSAGTGTFTQSGGINGVTGLSINSTGTYALSGGTLDVGASNISGTGTLTLSGTGILDLADTTGTNTVGTFNVNKDFTLLSGKIMNATTVQSVGNGITFTNDGGTNGIAGLNLNTSGVYTLSSGTTTIGSGNISGTGTLKYQRRDYEPERVRVLERRQFCFYVRYL